LVQKPLPTPSQGRESHRPSLWISIKIKVGLYYPIR
jgi:hypothetical protein